MPSGVQDIINLESAGANPHHLAMRIKDVRALDHSISFGNQWVDQFISAHEIQPIAMVD